MQELVDRAAERLLDNIYCEAGTANAKDLKRLAFALVLVSGVSDARQRAGAQKKLIEAMEVQALAQLSPRASGGKA